MPTKPTRHARAVKIALGVTIHASGLAIAVSQLPFFS